MASNRLLLTSLAKSKASMVRSLSPAPCPLSSSSTSSSFVQHPHTLSFGPQGRNRSASYFTTSARHQKPAATLPARSPVASSPTNAVAATASTASSSASSSNAAAVAAATAAARVSKNVRGAASLPFVYDPSGLSSQAIKKPSCQENNLKNTFYRRKLPDHLISFTSPKGKELFREMLIAGYGEGYFSLVGNFTTQSEPAFCGPASLAMVLNSLEIDPQRRWKGAWRWYSDELLECCAPRDQVKTKGITFSQFACLSKCHCDVQVRRAEQVSLDMFKKDLEMVCSRDDIHMVVSFSRKSLGQTGDGHFSPIGGYVPEKGMVLVLDTARYKYPSYFVKVEDLWKSLFPIDAETGNARGYFLLSANPNQPPISLCKLPKSATPSVTTTTATTAATAASYIPSSAASTTPASASASASAPTAQQVIAAAAQGEQPIRHLCSSIPPPTIAAPSALKTNNGMYTDDASANVQQTPESQSKMSWTTLAQTFCKEMPNRIQQANPQTLHDMIAVVLQGVPREYAFYVSQQQAYRLKDTSALVASVQGTELYSLVSDAFPAPPTNDQEQQKQHEGALVFGTLFLMSAPSTLFLTLPTMVNRQFERLRKAGGKEEENTVNRVLKSEVDEMRAGIVDLVNSFCTCSSKAAPKI
ncbi:hypothetical protein DFQ26_009153 [Actinomortierella ambigua]|nr:hypothetical protein DFQ26_009153 [Actinomortierella ambigua]